MQPPHAGNGSGDASHDPFVHVEVIDGEQTELLVGYDAHVLPLGVVPHADDEQDAGGFTMQDDDGPGETFHEPLVHVDVTAAQVDPYGTVLESYDVHVPPLAVVPHADDEHDAGGFTLHDDAGPGEMSHDPFVHVEVIVSHVEPYGTVAELYDAQVLPLGVVPHADDEHDEGGGGGFAHAEPFHERPGSHAQDPSSNVAEGS